MRPRRWAVGRGRLAVVATVVAVAVVAVVAVVVVSLGMITYLQKRRNGQTDRQTDLRTDRRTYGRTDRLIEMRGRI